MADAELPQVCTLRPLAARVPRQCSVPPLSGLRDQHPAARLPSLHQAPETPLRHAAPVDAAELHEVALDEGAPVDTAPGAPAAAEVGTAASPHAPFSLAPTHSSRHIPRTRCVPTPPGCPQAWGGHSQRCALTRRRCATHHHQDTAAGAALAALLADGHSTSNDVAVVSCCHCMLGGARQPLCACCFAQKSCKWKAARWLANTLGHSCPDAHSCPSGAASPAVSTPRRRSCSCSWQRRGAAGGCRQRTAGHSSVAAASHLSASGPV
jgi:hypothetical protein